MVDQTIYSRKYGQRFKTLDSLSSLLNADSHHDTWTQSSPIERRESSRAQTKAPAKRKRFTVRFPFRISASLLHHFREYVDFPSIFGAKGATMNGNHATVNMSLKPSQKM